MSSSDGLVKGSFTSLISKGHFSQSITDKDNKMFVEIEEEKKSKFVHFKIEKTELVTVKRRSDLEDLSCSEIAQNYRLYGFHVVFSEYELPPSIEGSSFTVSNNNNCFRWWQTFPVGLLRYRRDSTVNVGGHVPLQLTGKVSLAGGWKPIGFKFFLSVDQEQVSRFAGLPDQKVALQLPRHNCAAETSGPGK